jgi:hypothetical protein
MENERFIPLDLVCSRYEVEVTFIKTLHEHGLIEIMQQEERAFIDKDSLNELESMMNLYYDLDINVAGIDAIKHLLKKLREMQQEVQILKNKLNKY